MSGWIARFRDGPCQDTERIWAVPPIHDRLTFAPRPRRDTPAVLSHGDGWMLVGMGAGFSDVPWPGEVVYRLAEIADGEDLLVAWYEVARRNDRR